MPGLMGMALFRCTCTVALSVYSENVRTILLVVITSNSKYNSQHLNWIKNFRQGYMNFEQYPFLSWATLMNFFDPLQMLTVYICMLYM